MRFIFGVVYVLVLGTQLPHIWAAYAAIESPDLPLAQWTAIGAAVAFEASIGIFTFRIIKGNRRAWTKRGLVFFIAASIVANAYYYARGWWLLDWIWPVFATVALPLSLGLFAEEFGAETKREERAAKRAERIAEPIAQPKKRLTCSVCGRSFDSQAALSGHGNAHRTDNHKEHEQLVRETA